MFSKGRCAGALAALSTLLFCGFAPALRAQVEASVPAGSAQDSLGQRFESVAGGSPATRDGLAAMVTGYEDLILLEKRKFFTAWGTVSPQYTTNAALTPDGDNDFFVVTNLGIRAATVLAGEVNIYAGAGILSTRYHDFGELDYSAFTGNIGVNRDFRTSIGRINLGADYSPAVIYGRHFFANHEQTRHRISASAQLIKPLAEFSRLSATSFGQNSVLIPSLTLERVLTDPSDYKYKGATADLSLVYKPGPAWQVGGSIGAFWRKYDDYFEGLVGKARRDDGVRAAVYLEYLPLDFVTLSIGADYTDNNSTSDVNGYHSSTLSPGATFSVKF